MGKPPRRMLTPRHKDGDFRFNTWLDVDLILRNQAKLNKKYAIP
jgi:hypothetical protein